MFKLVNKIYFTLLKNEQRKILYKKGFKKGDVKIFEKNATRYYGYFIKTYIRDIRNNNQIGVDVGFIYDGADEIATPTALLPMYHIETTIADNNVMKRLGMKFMPLDLYEKFYVYKVNYQIPKSITLNLETSALFELLKSREKQKSSDIDEIKRYMNLFIVVKFYNKIFNMKSNFVPHVHVDTIDFTNWQSFSERSMIFKFTHVVCKYK